MIAPLQGTLKGSGTPIRPLRRQQAERHMCIERACMTSRPTHASIHHMPLLIHTSDLSLPSLAQRSFLSTFQSLFQLWPSPLLLLSRPLSATPPHHAVPSLQTCPLGQISTSVTWQRGRFRQIWERSLGAFSTNLEGDGKKKWVHPSSGLIGFWVLQMKRGGDPWMAC